MILVIGATGFLGKRVCRKLDDLRKDYVRTSLSLGVDLRDRDQAIRLFQKIKPEFVLNCAAFLGGVQFGYEHAAEMFKNNMEIELSILEACKEAEVKRLVNPIGNCSYPGIAKVYKEKEFWDGPLHESVLAYGFAKKAFCVGAWAYQRQYGTDIINLVFPNMYGPGDHFDPMRSHAVGGLIRKFVDAMDEGERSVVIWGTGRPVREWLYVDDGAEAMVRAMEIPYYPDIINIGMNKGYSILETAKIIQRLTGFNGELILDTSKIDGAPVKIMDVELCEKIFGWLPGMEYEEGLKRSIESYREYKAGMAV
ncbi:NAD-dependent epimerase/dehydratase family protein [Clostridiaceae bacterium]|nr:NAD-dependent epimerase/dehydratase family protein [Clostridiaceae bacterium]RKI12929.1 NAD-dependent epimerase/dehydratase family protein [bacterium 1XD21-70]